MLLDDPALGTLAAAGRMVSALLPHGGTLTPTELVEVTRRLVAEPASWSRVARAADGARRHYELLYEDDVVEVWVLAWLPSQTTGFHDHDGSGVGFTVARGAVCEELLRLGAAPSTRRLEAGSCRGAGVGYIHRLTWADGDPAVTVHAYSPRLTSVGEYRCDADGVLRRSVADGRQELTEELDELALSGRLQG